MAETTKLCQETDCYVFSFSFFLFFFNKNREAGAQISPLLKPSEPPDQIHAAQPNGKCVSQTEFKSAAVSRPPPSQPTVDSYFFMEDAVKFNTSTGLSVNSGPGRAAAGGKGYVEAPIVRLSCLKW